MKKIIIFLLLVFSFSFTQAYQFFTFEGNDQISFINEYNVIHPYFNAVWGNFLTFENTTTSLPLYSKNPNNDSAWYLQFWSYLGQTYGLNYAVFSSFIDWTDWSLAFLIWHTAPSYNTYWLSYAPTYAKTFTSWTQRLSPTLFQDYGMRFFSNTSWNLQTTTTSWFLQNWFKRADMIMALKNQSIDYHVWNSWYLAYSNKNVVLPNNWSPRRSYYYPSIWSSQAFITIDNNTSRTGTRFWTFWVFPQNQPMGTPPLWDNVLIINPNNPWTTFSTFNYKSILLRKWSIPGQILFTKLDCASPDITILNDRDICPVLSYWELIDWDWNPWFWYLIWQTINDLSANFTETTRGNLTFFQTWSEQIIQTLVLTGGCSSSFCGGGGVSYGGGAGDDSPLSWSRRTYDNSWNLIQITWDLLNALYSWSFQPAWSLNLFYCPYSWNFLSYKLSDIPWLGLIDDTSVDFDLFKPLSCMYSAYKKGWSDMNITNFPTLGNQSWLLVNWGTLYKPSDSNKNLFKVILDILLSIPAVYLFIKRIR